MTADELRAIAARHAKDDTALYYTGDTAETMHQDRSALHLPGGEGVSRTNPRSVILAALQEGPCSRINLWWLLMRANGLPDSPHRATPKQARTALRIDGHLDRHLCKLIRSRRVVRLGDGRYQARSRSD